MSKSYSKNIFVVFMAFVLVVGLCPLTSVQASAQPSSQSSSSQAAVQESLEGASSDTVGEAGSEASNKSAEGTNSGDDPVETQTSSELAAEEGLQQTSASSVDSNSNDTVQDSPEQLSTLPASTKVDESEEGSAYAAGEVLVTMKGSAESAAATETLQQAQTVKTNVVTEENVVSQDTLVAEVTDGATVAQAIAELETDPDVEAVQPNYIYTLMDDDSAEATAAEEIQQSIVEVAPQSSVTTNDPLAGEQWGLASAYVNEAWSLARCDEGKGVGVAVLDTGVKLDHPDLRPNIYGAYCSTTGETDTTATDANGHGTHVCGIVSAAINNIGVAGISYNAKIVPVRVFKQNGDCSTSDIIKGFTYVMDNKDTYNIRIINLSLGGVGSYDSENKKDVAFKNAIIAAYNADILTVCASGNARSYDGVYYSAPYNCWPGNFDEGIGKDTILTVGNITSTMVRRGDSNYGPTLDVMAPGTSILSTAKDCSKDYADYYEKKDGTSMAAPFASACAALCFAAKPSASVDEVRTCLENTATDLGPAGKDNEYGYGEVNAYAAVISMLGIAIQGQDVVETGSSTTYSLNNTKIADAVWSVSDTSKATINSSTGVLTPVSAGAVTITAKSGSYSWTKEVTIWPGGTKSISAAAASIPSQPYSGAALKPVPTVTYIGIPLAEGSDYSISYDNTTNAGTTTVTITGKGRFSGTKQVPFTITPRGVDAASITGLSSVPYTGMPYTPAPRVTLNGKTLTAGTDYTVSYANNTNAGTATVTIAGKGNYSGTKQTLFTITPKNLSAASVSSLPTVAYTGKAWTPTPAVSVGGKTLAKGTDYTLSYVNNTNAGLATVSVSGKGNYTGSKSVNFRIVDILSYTTHVQNIGWQNYVGSGTMAGTSGRSLRLEGIKIKTDASALGISGGITYQTHVQNLGWQREVSNNALSGTSGRSLRLEAIKIRLTGQLEVQYDVYYRVHAQDIGWMGWAKNGESAGTAGYSKRLEGIQIVLVPKNSGSPANNFRGITSVDTHPCIDSSATNGQVSYNATMHIQNKGNTNFSTSGSQFLGTTGSALRVEALTITKFNAPAGTNLGVRYRTHIQNIGWESSWKSVGQTSGTSGRALRLEALQLELTGSAASSYDVYYRTHIQNIGWTGWAKNGQQCGSAGYGYRMEAMQIVVVPKNGTAPGINSGYFYKR